MKTIKIATEYSDTPYGRYRTDGEFSGQRFREEFLTPALKGSEIITVDIDEVEGYGSSFLDEAFGGLVRLDGFTSADLHKRLKIKNANLDFNIYRDLIWKYIDEARPKKVA
jgi:hypothetical protein